MPLHEAAQNVVWFVVIVFIGIAVVMWRDARKESKTKNKDVRVR